MWDWNSLSWNPNINIDIIKKFKNKMVGKLSIILTTWDIKNNPDINWDISNL